MDGVVEHAVRSRTANRRDGRYDGIRLNVVCAGKVSRTRSYDHRKERVPRSSPGQAGSWHLSL